MLRRVLGGKKKVDFFLKEFVMYGMWGNGVWCILLSLNADIFLNLNADRSYGTLSDSAAVENSVCILIERG
jgi:hypothetical protein